MEKILDKASSIINENEINIDDVEKETGKNV